eukprot:scaffold33252_cov61-Phaeocystis_antarctica.AAC.2
MRGGGKLPAWRCLTFPPGGCRSMENHLGRGGEGSRTLMWTRRVECAGASARPTSASSRAREGGSSYFFPVPM